MNTLIDLKDNTTVLYKRYADELLDDFKRVDYGTIKPYNKKPLTPKQQKSRSKNKQAKKSRKNNRKN